MLASELLSSSSPTEYGSDSSSLQSFSFSFFATEDFSLVNFFGSGVFGDGLSVRYSSAVNNVQ